MRYLKSLRWYLYRAWWFYLELQDANYDTRIGHSTGCVCHRCQAIRSDDRDGGMNF